MSNTIRVMSMDPAFRNFGIAILDIDIDTRELDPVALRLLQTDGKEKKKGVRAGSVNLRNAQELVAGMNQMIERFDPRLACAEIPSGAQSSAAAYGFGVAVGVLGSCSLPIIQVTANEAKIAATGKKGATKDQMIAWATTQWPDLNWLRHGKRITKANEHLADALAIAKAATETAEFAQATAMLRSVLAA